MMNCINSALYVAADAATVRVARNWWRWPDISRTARLPN